MQHILRCGGQVEESQFKAASHRLYFRSSYEAEAFAELAARYIGASCE